MDLISEVDCGVDLVDGIISKMGQLLVGHTLQALGRNEELSAGKDGNKSVQPRFPFSRSHFP